MASTRRGSELTELHRRQQSRIAATTQRQVARLWPMLETNRLDETAQAWIRAALPLVVQGNRRSAELAAEYVRLFAAVEGRGSGRVVLSAPPAADMVGTSLRVTGPVAVKALTGSQFSPQAAHDRAVTAVAGTVLRHTLDGGRQTVMASALADPSSAGWRRVGSGGCGFCRMLIDRGSVYSSASARFGSHDDCRCVAEPDYGGEQLPALAYRPSARTISDADRARAREWIAANE